MTAKENSICCDTCSTWWHLPCADLTMTTADVLDSGVCQSCLADAAKAIDSDDDLEFNFAQESEETLASTDVNHVCPVCSTKSIPVNAEHYALFVKKAVHTWCSNHENVTGTSSADLIYNYCISD